MELKPPAGSRISTTTKVERFDPRICGIIVRIGAVVCVMLVVCTLILLRSIDPSNTRCPGWHIPPDYNASIWVYLAFATVWALVVCYYAATWEGFAQRIIDKIEGGERTLASGPKATLLDAWTRYEANVVGTININLLFFMVMAASAAFTAIPLVVLTLDCL